MLCKFTNIFLRVTNIFLSVKNIFLWVTIDYNQVTNIFIHVTIFLQINIFSVNNFKRHFVSR